MPARQLLVKVTAGPAPLESLERLAQGLTVAATASVSGADVSLGLTGEATRVAVSGADLPELAHSAPLAQLVADLLAAGARITVCTQCARRRDLTEADLLPGVRIAGAAAFVEEALGEGVQALVY